MSHTKFFTTTNQNTSEIKKNVRGKVWILEGTLPDSSALYLKFSNWHLFQLTLRMALQTKAHGSGKNKRCDFRTYLRVSDFSFQLKGRKVIKKIFIFVIKWVEKNIGLEFVEQTSFFQLRVPTSCAYIFIFKFVFIIVHTKLFNKINRRGLYTNWQYCSAGGKAH